jgi:hypothetical protein
MSGLAEALWGELTAPTLDLPGGWYPLRIPEGADLPAGTYQRISAVGPLTHDGGVALRTRRYQLTVFSQSYLDGLEAARSIVATLNGIRGTWDGWEVTAYIADDGEDMDPEPRGLFRQRVDVMITSEAP